MSTSPSNLLDLIKWERAFILYWHLSNENPLDWYGIEQRHGNSAIFRWNFTIQPHIAILASLRTTARIAGVDQRLAFVPFAINGWRHRSRWGAVRLVSTNGDVRIVRRYALQALACAQQLTPRMGWILEETGNDWVLWIVATGYREWDEWKRLLEAVMSGVDLDCHAVQYALFPRPAGLVKASLLGLRAPGAWNPTTDRIAEIYRHNLARFMPLVIRRYEGFIAKGAR